MSSPTVQQSRWRTTFDVTSTLLMVLAALALVRANWSRIVPTQAGTKLAVPREPVSIAGSPRLGSAAAAVAIIEFTEFECPFCGGVARDVLTRVDEDYIAPGKVVLIHKQYPLPFHLQAPGAAKAALCADGQGKYWTFQHLLFRNQDMLAREHLQTFATRAGMDVTEFNRCRDSDGISARLDADVRLGAALGVTSTPVFFFGSIQPGDEVAVSEVIAGAKPYAVFRTVLDRLLAQAKVQ